MELLHTITTNTHSTKLARKPCPYRFVAHAGRHSEKRLARNRMNFLPLRNVEERRRTHAPLLERRSLESSMSAESWVSADSGAPAHNHDQYTFDQISQKAMSIQILVARAGRRSEKRLGAQ